MYTEGNKFIVMSTNQPYIGFYNLYNGEYYTGKKYKFGISKRLQKLEEVNDIKMYNEFVGSKYVNSKYANEVMNIPINANYDNGYYYRYFCQIRNTLKILEINKEIYKKIQGNNYYKTLKIKWLLKGTIEFVGSKNKAIIQKHENIMPGLSKKVTNYLLFHKKTE